MKLGQVSIAALALGVFLGWDQQGEETNSEAEVTASRSSRRISERGAPGAGERNRAEVNRVLAIESPVDRLRAIVDLANSIPAGNIASWLEHRYFASKDPLQETLFRQIMLDRLKGSSPEEAMKLAFREHIGKAHVAIWMKEDPAAVENFILGPLDPDIRDYLAKNVLKEWCQSDPERALRILDGMSKKISSDQAWTLHKDIAPLIQTHRDELVELSKNWPTRWRYGIIAAIAGSQWKGDVPGMLLWLAEVEASPAPFQKIMETQRLSILPHLDLLPDGWFAAVVQRSDYTVVSRNPLSWLKADSKELGIDAQELELAQIKATQYIRMRSQELEEARLLVPKLTPAVQKKLVIRIITLAPESDHEGTEEWVTTLANPEVRAAAQAFLDQREGR